MFCLKNKPKCIINKKIIKTNVNTLMSQGASVFENKIKNKIDGMILQGVIKITIKHPIIATMSYAD